jgi:Protein adenylyltransferase SelO
MKSSDGKKFESVSSLVPLEENRNARLAMLNARFFGRNFGDFRLPHFLLENSAFANPLPESLASWSVRIAPAEAPAARFGFAPREASRAVLLSDGGSQYGYDIQVKGVGRVIRESSGNEMRHSPRELDGTLALSEACRDFVFSEILRELGVSVAEPLGIVEHGEAFVSGESSEWICNYVRAFRCHTRISDLLGLSPEDRKALVDDAIQRLPLSPSGRRMDYVEYFFFLLEIVTKSAAVYQATGFTQDHLHLGQLSLAGELMDFGIGHFDRSGSAVLAPWFRHERQPLLLQNLLYRSHALKAEPVPSEIPADSLEQEDCLFGLLRSFAPEAAKQIEAKDPVALFWARFQFHFENCRAENLRARALNLLAQAFAPWSPVGGAPADVVGYHKELQRVLAHYELDVPAWNRTGLPTAFCKLLWLQNSESQGIAWDLSLSLFGPEAAALPSFAEMAVAAALAKATWVPPAQLGLRERRNLLRVIG